VVVGGGLSGAMAACVFARGGLDVILVEADRIASAGTASGLGAIVPQPATSFRATVDAAGLRAARAAWKETRASALDLVAATKRLGIRGDLAPSPLVLDARTSEAAQLLRREQAARKSAGFAAPWMTASAVAEATGTESAGAIRLPECATIDPVRATLGFIRAAEQAGARVFERSAVRRTKFDRASADVVLADAVVHTDGVYVATGGPGTLFGQLRRHVREVDAATVVTEPLTSAMKREVGKRIDLVGECSDDARWLRWLKDDRAMFAGAASAPVAPRLVDRTLVQRTGQLMYELSLRHPVISGLPARWSWLTRIVTTADGLPWIGPHRNYPFHFFAVALGWHGEALAWFAAKAALRHFTGKAAKSDAAFGFLR
jgi:glycine/D-amino acid oxidase-like deaminating enzyme